MKVVIKSSSISLLFFCSLALVTSCKSANKDDQKPKIVKVATASKGNSALQKEFSFIAQPYRSSQLSFRVGGPIADFDVYAGNYYKQGEVIAEIDSRDFLIKKEKAEAIYRQAKAEFERIDVLYTKGNISANAFEKAKTDYTSAKMAFETAQNELKDTKLKAPFNGYVGEVYIEKYQDVKPTQTVISFVDIDKLKIEVYVTQDIAFNSQNLKTLNLSFDALPNKIYSAQIQDISKSTTKNNLSYLLTAILPNTDGKLLAGMSGKVFFDMGTVAPQSLVSVPQIVICHRPAEGDYIWIVNPTTQILSKRLIKLGALQANGNIEVVEGLSEGEMVAASGLRFLSEGMKIEIAK